ncbi:MAG: hypothetical protein F4Z32_00595 [Gemmatimonadetes bacterium]|nr:hypothetical protein [Gemmatimonadota bacterium]
MDNRELRLEQEHELIVSVFPSVVRSEDWFLLQNDTRAIRCGWTPDPFPVAFHAQPGHPGQVPYGIYVAAAVRVGGDTPNNFSATAANSPPFSGEWGVLSWQGDEDGLPWFPKQEVRDGANLLNFLITFEERFKQGA